MKKRNFLDYLNVYKRESDESLMDRVSLEGDKGAFETLYLRYNQYVSSYIRGLIGGHNQLEDIVQEAFFKVYRKRSLYKNGSRFRPWFWAIARNTAFDELRKRKDTFLDDLYQDESGFEVSDDSPDAEILLINKMESQKLEVLINKLHPTQRDVLLLKVFGEMNYDEIAESTGKSLASIKSSLFRATKELKLLIREGHEF